MELIIAITGAFVVFLIWSTIKFYALANTLSIILDDDVFYYSFEKRLRQVMGDD